MAFSAINIHINVSIILDPVFDDVSPVFMEGYSDSLVHWRKRSVANSLKWELDWRMKEFFLFLRYHIVVMQPNLHTDLVSLSYLAHMMHTW